MPPTKLGENDHYVFALPARYNYAFPKGWEEVDQIMKSNPLSMDLTFDTKQTSGYAVAEVWIEQRRNFIKHRLARVASAKLVGQEQVLLDTGSSGCCAGLD